MRGTPPVAVLREGSGVAAKPADSEPPAVETRQRFARPLAGSFAASGVLLARELGPGGRGELAAALLWPGLLAMIGSFGVFQATTYYAASATAMVRSLITTAVALAIAEAAVMVAVGAAVIPIALGHYGDPTLRAAYIYLAYIPINLVALFLMAVLNGLQRFGWFQALRVAVIVTPALALVTFAISTT